MSDMTADVYCHDCGKEMRLVRADDTLRLCGNLECVPRVGPFWHCNKCMTTGRAASALAAEHWHAKISPACDYLPSWNWQPDGASVPSGGAQ